MKNAANEFRFNQKDDSWYFQMIGNNFENTIADITVSRDGSWQKRGFLYVNGPVTLIASDSDKCEDYWVLRDLCSSCSI